MCVCALGDEGFFLHKDAEACDPEGVHGQLYSGGEKPEAESWEPHVQQLHAGCKSVCLLSTSVYQVLYWWWGNIKRKFGKCFSFN